MLELGASWCRKIRDVMDTGERLARAKRTGRAAANVGAEPPWSPSHRASPSAPYTVRAAPPLSILRPLP